MGVPNHGQIDTRSIDVTIAVRTMARGIIAREQGASGVTQEQAAKSVARRIREAPGTIMRLIKGRAKRIDAAVRDKLTAYAIGQIEEHRQRLEHELALARACGPDPRAAYLDEAQALLDEAKKLMKEARP
jgi:hypothetical protein